MVLRSSAVAWRAVAALVVVGALACACVAAPLDIWVVPHSHDDTGWKLTVDEYYEYQVQYILDSVVTALLENPDRRFIQVEIAFFERWWGEQSRERKEDVRMLVRERRLVFVGGGWCMHDEAVTNYVAQINQLTQGHSFLLREFGEHAAPKVAWHIDPFGASSMSPAIFSQAGYEAFVIDRIDYRLKESKKEAQELEFVWRGCRSLGAAAQLFTHVLDSFYITPGGFRWEHGPVQLVPWTDGSEPVLTAGPSYVTPANVAERAAEFVSMARQRAAYFRTPNVLIPFGDDFHYQNANMQYKNLDRLIAYVNAHSEQLGATAHYSTLDDYFAAVAASNTTWSVKENDFFPYIDRPAAYWTGFYSSRPDVKQLSREADAALRFGELALSFADACAQGGARSGTANRSAGVCGAAAAVNTSLLFSEMQLARRATALVQHHDGVTGTERKHVAADYKRRLADGNAAAAAVGADVLAGLYGDAAGQPLAFGGSTDELAAALRAGQRVLVSVYNALEQTRTDVAQLPVPLPHLNVTDAAGAPLPFDVSDAFAYDASQPYELFVRVRVPAMGYATFVVAALEGGDEARARAEERARGGGRRVPERERSDAETIGNEWVTLRFEGGGLQRVNTTAEEAAVRQGVVYYEPAAAAQTSGAYIFRPAAGAAPVELGVVSVRVFRGAVVQQVRQDYNESGVSVVTRLFAGLDAGLGSAVQQRLHVGPIDEERGELGGKEMMMRVSSSICSGDVFHTDLNGMEVLQRRRNLTGRPGDVDSGVALAGNFYPVTSRMFLADHEECADAAPRIGRGTPSRTGSASQPPRQLTLLTAHSHGGSSVAPGDLTLSVHRRLLRNDFRGVGRPLDDTSAVTARFMLMLSNTSVAARLHRPLANVLQYPLVLAFAPLPPSPAVPPRVLFSPLAADLPLNVRMITLKPLVPSGAVLLLRLMNIFAVGEDPQLSQPAAVDLATLFSHFKLVHAEERTLTGLHAAPAAPSYAPLANTTVTLAPMQIRTFWVSLVAAE